jgi:hypothetical protein
MTFRASDDDESRLKVILVGGTGVSKKYLKKSFDSSVISTVSPVYLFRDVVRRDGCQLTDRNTHGRSKMGIVS